MDSLVCVVAGSAQDLHAQGGNPCSLAGIDLRASHRQQASVQSSNIIASCVDGVALHADHT